MMTIEDRLLLDGAIGTTKKAKSLLTVLCESLHFDDLSTNHVVAAEMVEELLQDAISRLDTVSTKLKSNS
jgi:hypothetical protein